MADFAAIFDMDGVIVDSNPVHVIALHAFSKKYGKSFSEEEMKKHLFGRRNAEWLPYFFDRELSAKEVDELGGEKEAMFRELYADTIEPLAGLPSFLESLKSEGIPCIIGTSAPPENAEFVLEKTGLGSYFSQILDARFVEIGKPHPDIYLKCAKAAGFPPSQCIVFEDALAGVAAGVAAGCKVVGVTTTHAADEMEGISLAIPDFEKLTVGQLKSLL